MAPRSRHCPLSPPHVKIPCPLSQSRLILTTVPLNSNQYSLCHSLSTRLILSTPLTILLPLILLCPPQPLLFHLLLLNLPPLCHYPILPLLIAMQRNHATGAVPDCLLRCPIALTSVFRNRTSTLNP